MERSTQQSIQTPRASAEDKKPTTKPKRGHIPSSTANEQFKTRWRVALGTAQTIKINTIVTVTSIITTRSNQVQHDNAQHLKHFKNAKQKLKYAEHPSLSRRENKLQYETFNSTTHASKAQCPKKPSINQTCKSASPSTAGRQTTAENEDKQSPIRQTRSASPYSNAAHSQPHQIINHVSNTYSCKSRIHEWREVSSRILNNIAQHRHRMPSTDKTMCATAATIPRIKLKNPSSRQTTKRQKAVSSLHALCKQYSHNAICIIIIIVDHVVHHTTPHVLQLPSFQTQHIGKHNMQIMLPNKHRNRQARHQNHHQHRHFNESQSTATSQQQPPSPSTQQGSSMSQYLP
jgi:hypothetical protein